MFIGGEWLSTCILTDSRSLMDMIPFILSEERARLRTELSGKFLSIIFDGTTRLGEVLAIVVRFVDGWTVKQRLVRLEFLQKVSTTRNWQENL